MVVQDNRLDILLKEYQGLLGDSKEKDQLYDEILTGVRSLVYFMPQEIHGLQEDECAEFMLYFESRLPNLIEAYKPEQGGFRTYIFPIIKNNIRGFRKIQAIKDRQEEAVLFDHVAYESTFISENPTEDLAVADIMQSFGQGDDLVVKRLQFILANCEKARKRFFVYFISHTVLMLPEQVIQFCETFGFNKAETLQLFSEVIQNNINNDDILQHALNKRDEYYGKKLFIEREIDRATSDGVLLDKLQRRLDRYNNYYHYQEVLIRRNQKRVPRPIISKLFNLSEGTIATFIYYSNNLLSWCFKPDIIPEYPIDTIGVKKSILSLAQDESQIEKIQISKEPIFNPSQCFNMKKVELSD